MNRISLEDMVNKNRRKTLISNMNKQNALEVESLNSDKLSINQLAVLP